MYAYKLKDITSVKYTLSHHLINTNKPYRYIPDNFHEHTKKFLNL